MTVVMSLVGLAALVVMIVCWIMVLVRIFKENVGLGILGIVCNLFAFIYGWVKVKEYGIKQVMIVWTVAWVVMWLAYSFGAASMVREIMSGMENGGGM